MRNAEAARYARWAAAAAFLIVVATAGVYLDRAVRASHARRLAPPPVPETVQQQSAEFSFSKVVQERTIFTIRAKQATEFKDQDRSLLEDVWISLYGRDGSRNDSIHTKECSYAPTSGDIRCQGAVRIGLESAQAARERENPRAIEVETRNLSFNRESGEASTSEKVEFRFPGGEGRGLGVDYNPSDAKVILQRDIELKLIPPNSGHSTPAVITGSRLEFRRDDSTIHLLGPVRVRQGDRQLTAGELALLLDSDMHARRVVANGTPELHSVEPQGKIEIAADQFQAELNSAGGVERVLMEGNVRASREMIGTEDLFAAQHVSFEMEPKQNQPREMTASGAVQIKVGSGEGSQRLETAALHLAFVPSVRPSGLRIGSAETLGPGTIDLKTPEESLRVRAQKFTAEFDSRGRLDRLLGHSGIELNRQSGSAAPQMASSRELDAAIGPGGQWTLLELNHDVKFSQADRTAGCEHARINRSADLIRLEGSAHVSDASAQTAAPWFEINQRSGALRAGGGVRSTSLLVGKGNRADLGSGPAHISADTLDGYSSTGHLIYTGHSRFWQGEALLEADAIEIWREESRLDARGNVAAVFLEQPSTHANSSTPTLWEIRAPLFRYWSEAGRARLENGVTAVSTEGALLSQTLDLYLASTGPQKDSAQLAQNATMSATGGRQVVRALASGGVVVKQGNRQGTAQQAEYTAADGKFVLSGGLPTFTDATGDTVTGRSLTFFVANDTILIDSHEGSRTLTKHRVEK